MLILIASAKTLDFETPVTIDRFAQPDFLTEAEILVKQLRNLSVSEIALMMKMSDKLAKVNVSRYQTWQSTYDNTQAKQALLAFQGDVYQGLKSDRFTTDDFDFAQDHLRILSGLYGLLKPLDLIQPYRLEMGTKLTHPKLQDLKVNNLYDFWQNKLTQAVNQQLSKLDQQVIINLASNEYFKVLQPQLLSGDIITPVFKDWHNGTYKIISFYAKQARGMMAAYLIKNKIQNIKDIQTFAEVGYSYNSALSDNKTLVFTRQ
ncbi:hypothetical protein NIES4102_21330 [Chondrocystis sp. NIES-4102]|nr:hypothetical protein NIES4102_21330 [Chondrocystis sp. NIES-4102]